MEVATEISFETPANSWFNPCDTQEHPRLIAEYFGARLLISNLKFYILKPLNLQWRDNSLKLILNNANIDLHVQSGSYEKLLDKAAKILWELRSILSRET